MKQYIFLFIILVLAVAIPFFLNMKNPMQMLEGYSNYNLAGSQGKYPNAQTSVLVQDTYPAIGKNSISNASSSDIWTEYPVFQVGSYDQITNNIRYPDNPDDGKCSPASMCNALYYNKKVGNNYVTPLSPVNIISKGTRINYYDTDVNLLPFRSNMSNILY
jgi:hypothetical protein